MKNTKLTKDMKHNIAHAMYNVYHNKKVWNIGGNLFKKFRLVVLW